jgi:hypothetical protein
MSFLCFLSRSPFLDGQENLSEYSGHDIIELIELFVGLIDHVVDDPHDFWCVVSALFLLEDYYFFFGDSADEVILNSAFVVDLRDL